MSHPHDPTADLTAKARIRLAALHLFAQQGVAATSLRAVARDSGVTPGLVVHHFGGKDGLKEAVEDQIVALLADAVGSVPLTGSGSAVGKARDAAVAAVLCDHPDVVDYLRRGIVTPDPGDETMARKLADLVVGQTVALREAGLSRSTAPVTEQAITILIRQLGNLLLQPALARLWEVTGSDGPPPHIAVALRPVE